MYKLDQFGQAVRDDGVIIPNDPANMDHQDYLAWCEAGNAPEPFFEIVMPATAEMVRAEGARRLALIGAPYSPEERETWSQQVMEAKAVQANANADAPLLTLLAAADDVRSPPWPQPSLPRPKPSPQPPVPCWPRNARCSP